MTNSKRKRYKISVEFTFDNYGDLHYIDKIITEGLERAFNPYIRAIDKLSIQETNDDDDDNNSMPPMR